MCKRNCTLHVVEEHTQGLKAASLGRSALESPRKVAWAEGMWGMSPCIGHLVSCGALWWAERGLQARWGAPGGWGSARSLGMSVALGPRVRISSVCKTSSSGLSSPPCVSTGSVETSSSIGEKKSQPSLGIAQGCRLPWVQAFSVPCPPRWFKARSWEKVARSEFASPRKSCVVSEPQLRRHTMETTWSFYNNRIKLPRGVSHVM